jgi:hypothetical protein
MFVLFLTWKPVSPPFYALDTQEINGALEEVYEEIEKKLVTKGDLNSALAE